MQRNNVNMDIKKIQSDLKMEKFYFKECSITRDTVIESGPYSFDLQKDVSELTDGTYSVVLTLRINKEQGDMAVKVVAAATFSLENDDAEFVNTIMNKNTIAIMFPFIRSQVSLLTTQPGMTPIILPPINTAKFKSN